MTLYDIKRRIERDIYDRPLAAILTHIVDEIATKLVTAQGLVLEADARAQAVIDRMVEDAASEPARADVVREVTAIIKHHVTNAFREEPMRRAWDKDVENAAREIVAALAAYDAAPPAPAPDAAAIRAQAFDQAAVAAHDAVVNFFAAREASKADGGDGRDGYCGHDDNLPDFVFFAIRALRAAPAPETVEVTMEEIKAWFAKPSGRVIVTHESLACDFVEHFAGRTITRKD